MTATKRPVCPKCKSNLSTYSISDILGISQKEVSDVFEFPTSRAYVALVKDVQSHPEEELLCSPCKGPQDLTPIYKRLREALRHYTEFKAHVSASSQHVFEHGGVQISFYDLQKGIKELSPRKKEALFYNVILDWKQKDVAEKMGITTVSVGQYVDGAVQQLAKRYFAEREDEHEHVEDVRGRGAD